VFIVLKKQFLMIPGPTMVPERVIQAMTRPVINHRGVLFEGLLKDCTQRLKTVFQTNNDVILFPSSGTGVMEAAIANFVGKNEKVLALTVGVFGERWAEIARRYGADVEVVATEVGYAIDPKVVEARLAKDTNHEIKVILVTHNETSASVTNDVQAISAARGSHPALLMVDSVSGLGAMELKTDDWNLDVVVAGSQKSLMIPPGIGVMAVSAKAWAKADVTDNPKFYWDAKSARKALEKWQNPYTPPVSLLFGLQEALKMIEEEGLATIFVRHRKLRNCIRAAAKALGLKLLAQDYCASNAVTGIYPPEGVEAKKVQKIMRETYGVTMAGGQKALEGKIFRIGHMGYCAISDVMVTITMLEMTLVELGMKVELGAGVRAAQQEWMKA
jgi:aspartate aminotransferase-like enzyme